MLKFIKGNLEAIEGVSIYPIISLLIFFTFFTLLFVYVFTAKKDPINTLSEMPLNEPIKTQEDE
ncbi:MAG: CcoQ/FixQ family Cbb3-type cytochrome c oxidase assembly chaperone [Nonlabens ulvanivorans]|uniref:CcoQ/FixQ family Cbb3-type cytochrome c oxidase assembly chaperone n=1 Tax=Nonlabens ulvanivorans TaxID=906888 RepID=UPI003296A16F